MYIIKNAWKSITRNKGRNILFGIISLVIAVSSCVALSIRQAADTAKQDTLAGMKITASITFDRSKVMSGMLKSTEGTNRENGFERKNFDFSAMQGETLTLDDYMKYAEAQSDGDSYYYTNTASLDASGDILPYGDEESESSAGMPGRDGNQFSFIANGDFSVTGFSSYEAMMSLFGTDGTCTISDGKMFDEGTDANDIVISDELAMYNNLNVGDTITLANPNYEGETYDFTICGIYTNTSSDNGNSMFSRSDPANNIYMSYNALKAVSDASSGAGNTVTEDSGNSRSAALTNEVSFTYVFTNADHYYAFEDQVHGLGLSENYTVSSQDLSAFENSLTPLETLGNMAGWFFIIVITIGGVILVVLNIFSLRERKYEVGVLSAIGMKKNKIASQFVCELFSITLVAIIIGAAAGACISVPVTNKLLAAQIESTETSTGQVSDKFGFGGEMNNPSGMKMPDNFMNRNEKVSYVDSVSAATNVTVILELIAVGIFLTILSSLAAMITIMRYEPLKILSDRA